jgi:hypothetical protein
VGRCAWEGARGKVRTCGNLCLANRPWSWLRADQLMLSGPHRPSQDAVLDYLISVTGEGLAAETVVRALKGIRWLPTPATWLTGSVLGWRPSAAKPRGAAPVEANWANRGHVTSRFQLRSTCHPAGREGSAEFDLEAGAEMQALSAEVAGFFAASREG